MAVVELVLPARRDYLALVRLVVSAAAATSSGLSGVRLDDLRLAVSEACANAIDAHHDLGTTGPPLRIRCEIEADAVTVLVEDRGGGFDPAGLIALPGVADPGRLQHERGLGVPLMRSLVDDVEFEATTSGTIVRLRVRRQSASA